MNKEVAVKSETRKRVSINLSDIRLKRVWEKKGTVRKIPFEDLKEALYNPGVEYMFRNGLLSIDDMETKIELGLEEEGAEKPSIVILSDAEKETYLNNLTMPEFREKVNALPVEQIKALVDYAIEKEIMQIDKTEFLKRLTGTDIINAIKLNRQANEVENK